MRIEFRRAINYWRFSLIDFRKKWKSTFVLHHFYPSCRTDQNKQEQFYKMAKRNDGVKKLLFLFFLKSIIQVAHSGDQKDSHYWGSWLLFWSLKNFAFKSIVLYEKYFPDFKKIIFDKKLRKFFFAKSSK